MRAVENKNQSEPLPSAIHRLRTSEVCRVEDRISAIEEISMALIESIKQIVRSEVQAVSIPAVGLLLKKELADRLQVSVSTISKMQTEGLPTIQFGKSVRFDYDEALAWVKARRDLGRGERKLRMVA